jgi:hypothetical protein
MLMSSLKSRWTRFGIAVILGLVVVLALWGGLFLRRETLNFWLARQVPWPIACSLRGCVTTITWEKHWQVRKMFAETAEQPVPTQAQALTTLVRQHLVKHAFLRVPVSKQDAVRYREEILNAREEPAVFEATGLTLDDYDMFVILPLLQQEALRQERSVESLGELFTLLASERPLVVLSWPLKWDKETATVVER